MKKPKISFGEGGIKQFFVQNFEKGLFGVIALVGLFMVYKAFNTESEKRLPADLIKDANTAEQALRSENWEQFKAAYPIPPDPVDEVNKNIAKKLPALEYQHAVPFIKSEQIPYAKRFDPTLLAVQDLEIIGRFGVFPFSPGKNRLAQLEPGTLRSLSGDDGKVRKPRKKKPRSNPMMGYGMEMQMEMPEPVVAAPLTTGDEVSAAVEREMEGVRVSGAADSVGLYPNYFVCVTGVVPFREQVVEFRKLRDAVGFHAQTDYPKYVRIEVERMDLAAPGGAWVDVTETLKGYSEKFAVSAPEVCDKDYFDERIALPAIPLLSVDPSDFGLHSRIPERKWIEVKKEEAKKEEAPIGLDPFSAEAMKKKAEAEKEKKKLAPVVTSSANVMLEPNEAPEFKLVRFYDIVRPGQKFQYRVRLLLVDPNLPATVVSGAKDDELAANSPSTSNAGTEAENMEIMMQIMMAEQEAGNSGQAVASATKLDLKHGNSKINESMLDDVVRERLRSFKASAKFELEDEDARFGMPTPWSEPSKEVTVPALSEQFYAGRLVKPADEREANGVKFAEGDPKAELVMTQFNPTYATNIPIFAEIYRGSTLNQKQIIKVLHPIDLSVREIRGAERENPGKDEPKFEGVAVATDSVVIDISGGRVLPNKQRSSHTFREPTEILVFDGSSFKVTDELDDIRLFREYSLFDYEDDEPVKPVSGGGSGLP
jgi:hypothetical protein